MKDSIWNKRIPTLLGLTMISIGIFVTTILVQTGVITIGQAAPLENPENVRITNITANAFTVSYTTRAKVLGALSYGVTSDYGSIAFDDRDQKNETAQSYNLHYMTIKNLQPATQYFFSITSGKDTYLHNDAPFQITTGPLITQEPPSQAPASGKIILPDGKIPTEAIVYVSSTGTETLSALITNGSFILPLNSLRTENLTAYAMITKDQKLNGLVIDPTQSSTILLLASQINPIPLITLSQNYDFTAQTTPIASPSAQTSFPSFTATLSSTTPEILTPKNDQGFSDAQPIFKGTAQPGEEVQVIVHSEQEFKTTVTANASGNWSYRPPQDLNPGEHTITIITRDASGIIKQIMRPFTVYAQGSQVGQSATPSATPRPTTIPTAVPTVAATIAVPTPTPTIFVQPSPTVQIMTPTPALAVGGTKGGEPEAPGSSTTMILGFAAIITTSFGLFLFLLAKRNTTI